ncbi:hypothetical protein [Nonomuraea cavernae]|uniref:Uncharacterized protein n=1 Tax=Nonomuraea cavernae TaxID=2045107 RepID=A0A918DHG7_9ACTN|nr:hypothetical protein [Nonomuraea cavernae]MCA2184258.1 hypothetical protein [Nonomuraea cavernae]GGO64355.1 hypothetical protein GCM10012289_13580 [Nonomuraea cavernae]
MTTMSWYSQPFPAEGASVAEGIRNQLGRPELDLLTILVRESAQNSWDARLRDHAEPVDYTIEMWTVGPAHAMTWRNLLSRNAPLNTYLPLRQTLQNSTIRVMAISDRGTSGLGGPTRADEAVTKEHDFVSFVRNVGEPRDTELGGGTYGFGKGIFYLISRPGTILLHTRCIVDGAYETRLMGCALWKSYVASESGRDRRYTGRHWWGDVTADVVEPLVGNEAETAARQLGLRPFKDEETGTTIVIIDPNLEGREPAEAADYLAETITWHLWPKMLDSPEGRPSMRFSVVCDGVEHPVPDPRETRPLNLFVAAYQAMEGVDGKVLECLKPKKRLGRFGLVKRTAPALEATDASRMLNIESAIHHVCLMRPAELVVTYRPGPKPPSEYQHYAGVFRADVDLDEIYAKAEPPTHDAWNPQSLEFPESTYVNTTFRRIDDELTKLFGIGGGARGVSAKVALGAASTMFASLVGGSWGTGGATDYGKPGSTETPSRNPVPAASDQETNHPPGDSGASGNTGTGSTTHPDMTATSADASSAPPTSSELLDESRTAGGSGPSGTGARWMGGGSPVTPPRRRPRVEYIGNPYHGERSDIPVLIQEFRLPVPGTQRVRVDLAVALTGVGGRETEAPLGAETPRLIGLEGPDGTMDLTPSPVVEGGDGTTWRAIIRPAPDTMTEIDIAAEAVYAS